MRSNFFCSVLKVKSSNEIYSISTTVSKSTIYSTCKGKLIPHSSTELSNLRRITSEEIVKVLSNSSLPTMRFKEFPFILAPTTYSIEQKTD